MKKVEELTAYEVIERKQSSDLNSLCYLLRHKKTGARIVLLSNDDNNKVFYIGFRTPPTDSTGVAHIIEHTVLCGSEKYPAKDPFIELAKGSLNTFLNTGHICLSRLTGCLLKKMPIRNIAFPSIGR